MEADPEFREWLLGELAGARLFLADFNEPMIARTRAAGRVNTLQQVADKLNIHELGEARKLSYPGGKDGMYIVECSCGYVSQPSGWPRRAEKPAEDHKAAREANSDANGDGEDRA